MSATAQAPGPIAAAINRWAQVLTAATSFVSRWPLPAVAISPIVSSLRRKLTEALSPTQLSVVNDSGKHAGHSGNPSGAPDAETHFRRGAAQRPL